MPKSRTVKTARDLLLYKGLIFDYYEDVECAVVCAVCKRQYGNSF